MHILHVISSLRVGGAEKIVKDLTLELNNSGHVVDVAVFDGTESMFKRELLFNGCRVYVLSRRGIVYSPYNIIGLLKLMGSYEIVHAHNTAPQFFVAICSIFVKTLLVTTEHSTSNRRRNNPIWFFFDRWMYSRFNKIVCVSDSVRDSLSNYLGRGFKLEKINTIYNGIDVDLYHETKGYNRLSFCPEAVNKFIVCMVAGFREEKDQDTLIRAFSLLPRDEFVLWLVGDGERRRDLNQLVSILDLDSNVYFWGIRSDIAALLHTADAIVMSSHHEGLSLSSIEGMSVGKPFISSDVVGLREIVGDSGILFPYRDYNALAEIIMELAKDKTKYTKVSDLCYERAKKYSIKEMVKQYCKLYSELNSLKS